MHASSRTLVSVFEASMQALPERVAVCALDGIATRASWTRAALWHKAEAIATALAAHGVTPGTRVLVLQPDGPELAVVLMGLWLRRATPLIAPSGLTAVERGALETSSRAVLALTPAATTPSAPKPAGAIPELDVLEAARSIPIEPNVLLRPTPDDVAVVQYGSGPRFTPRGIVLTHGALAANIVGLGTALGLGPEDRALSWSPMSHDMGLVGGLLMALWWGYPVDLMRTEAVLVQPVRWLEALSARKATLTAGPNFAWQMCVRRVRDEAVARLDLSHLRVALTGSETVQPETCHAFAQRFAAAGFRAESFTPAYGLAEHVLAVSVGPPGRALHVVHGHVALGRPLAGHEVAIRDGEIIVRGPSVMRGYLDDPEATRAAIDADGWLATGDWGALVDGEVVMLGRKKDMVIRRGKNFYVVDVEALVARALGEGGGEVFATAMPDSHEGTEGLVVLAETAAVSDAIDEAVMARNIVTTIVTELGLGGARVRLIEPGGLPRQGTVLDRSACRQIALEAVA